ncbi:twin-arginine translocase TatA/TatE family subunit [bacterium]|nr:twin-arginine translocase TatA/TatE family subunit [bacterium]MBU1652984.1 twin-arginine translocase TatA/TatE family subunit [bacterium]
MGLGHWEILAIAVAVLLIFGGKKIPELMKGVGSGMREFRKGIKGEEEVNNTLNENNTNDSPKN